MFDLEAQEYPIILTVHDEVVALTPTSRSDLNVKQFENIMSILPHWAEGLPLSVKAWEYGRYVK
jgi:DNA polymerase